jgi:hypothetical protein
MVADTTNNFLEQIVISFPIIVSRAVTKANRGKGADVEDSWQTNHGTVHHLQVIRFNLTTCIQLSFHAIWVDGKN